MKKKKEIKIQDLTNKEYFRTVYNINEGFIICEKQNTESVLKIYTLY